MVFLEGLIIFSWRAKLYSGVSSLALAKYELERATSSAIES
jgi:hypothetical protein